MKKLNDFSSGAIVDKSHATKTYAMASVSTFPKRSRLYDIFDFGELETKKSLSYDFPYADKHELKY